ncbi:hypothetical protein FXB40_21650 [Bradyrhizobium rifense]|uniref:Uncharacterized protein n=1 Tax=Bradyrhizobium rifense TaxID=515499 RepID=A0A5D3KFE7_9BRAD|nr:hypothetical protein [Bradyrhizobium rifense]TYL93438.1 hypothetical protein FXB40_21650 [Bradyrhizobium rifense]
MAPPRKKRRPGEGHPVHLRFPTDVFEWIEAETKEKGWPLNRVIINEMAAIPYLKKQAKLGELIRDMEVILADYGSRLTLADLGEPMLRAVDQLLAAKTDSERQIQLDRLRVLRSAMLKNGRATKE